MLARIRKAQEENEGGFTLIELLVVIIIIGILAAIAIPVFLNQREKATESGMKSDLRTQANEIETAYTDTQAYPASGAAPVVKKSDTATTLTYTLDASGQSYCILAVNTKVTNKWFYDSNGGGLGLGAACP
ncbi:MAG: prepilin-type N-terminal cleavage/methylation domain-containing protein [Actinomycetes bacterium]